MVTILGLSINGKSVDASAETLPKFGKYLVQAANVIGGKMRPMKKTDKRPVTLALSVFLKNEKGEVSIEVPGNVRFTSPIRDGIEQSLSQSTRRVFGEDEFVSVQAEVIRNSTTGNARKADQLASLGDDLAVGFEGLDE